METKPLMFFSNHTHYTSYRRLPFGQPHASFQLCHGTDDNHELFLALCRNDFGNDVETLMCILNRWTVIGDGGEWLHQMMSTP